MDMVEKVAKSVYEKRNGPGCLPWAHQTKGHRDPYLADARAALEAMREPTGAMIEAGMHKPFPGEAPRLDDDTCLETWQAMIDAACSRRQ